MLEQAVVKPYLLRTVALFITLALGACSKSGNETAGTSVAVEEPLLRPFAESVPELVFNHDVSAILGADDPYTRSLSRFDYAAKFNSDRALSPTERAEAFRKALQHYSEDEIRILKEAFTAVFEGMKGMHVKLPKTIHIFSEQTIESGAAYTRAHTICMPKQVLSRGDMDAIKDLAAHELFHVLSRYNPELRTPIYASLGFRPVASLVLQGELATRTIANPDAPDNNHAIRGEIHGKTLDFMPILYSATEFRGGSFFQYLHDDLIAVRIDNGTPTVMEHDGKPFIVKKEQVGGYFEQIGRNTTYTFHPEETSADHFKQLLFWDIPKLPNPEKIKALEQILRPQPH